MCVVNLLQADQETEWKFVRSKLYMEYIKADGTLPVPLNLVPTPRTLSRMFRHCFGCGSDAVTKHEDEETYMGINGGGRLLTNKVLYIVVHVHAYWYLRVPLYYIKGLLGSFHSNLSNWR